MMTDERRARRVTESFTIAADAVHLGGMEHKVEVGDVGEETFVFQSDEGPALGGANRHPWPLHYLIAGVAF
jgi:hypothetical protein